MIVPAYSGFLAIRYLVTRWVNILGMLGVAVAVWALIVVIAVFSGFIGDIRRSIRIATPDLLCTGLPPETSFEEIDAQLREDPDVAATAPRLRHYGLYFPYGEKHARTSWRDIPRTPGLMASPGDFDFVELIGIDPTRERETTQLERWLQRADDAGYPTVDPEHPLTVPTDLEEYWRWRSGQPGTPGPLLDSSPGILVSTLRMRGRLEIGQQLSVLTARFVLRGDDTDLVEVRRYFTVAGGFRTGHRVLDENTALVSIDAMREMLGQHPDDFQSIDLVSDVAIRVKDGADPALVAARLHDALAARYGATVLTWEEQNRVFLGAVDQERGMMKLILFAVMLVAAFLIYSTLHMTVTQKTKDIGILSSMGASPGGVLRIFLISGAVVGVVGSLTGVAGGLLSAYYLNDVNDWTRANFDVELFPTKLYALDRIPYQIEPAWVAQVVALALLITLVAAWLPARRAARMDPVRALSYE